MGHKQRRHASAGSRTRTTNALLSCVHPFAAALLALGGYEISMIVPRCMCKTHGQCGHMFILLVRSMKSEEHLLYHYIIKDSTIIIIYQ